MHVNCSEGACGSQVKARRCGQHHCVFTGGKGVAKMRTRLQRARFAVGHVQKLRALLEDDAKK